MFFKLKIIQGKEKIGMFKNFVLLNSHSLSLTLNLVLLGLMEKVR